MTFKIIFSENSFFSLIIILILNRLSTSDGLRDGINTVVVPPGGASSGCGQMLSSFAIASGNFTYCTLRNARPITLCRECINKYLNVRHIYSDILALRDTGGQSCKDELFNLDRLQAVDAAYKYVVDLWARASCDTCFVLDGSGCPTPTLTVAVQNILNASVVLNDCIDKYHNGTQVPDLITCKECINNYTHINNLYASIKADNGDINFCMDIIDLMNSTRNQWSGTLGCCNDRRKPEMIFLLSSAGVSVISVLFYFMAFAFTKKKEQRLAIQNRWNGDRSAINSQ
ncbi:hypothetical protein O3M35_003555 [Rhynocoris fuscipes]|uniref:Osteopetrosis-associated transmembrane protein 1 n=1 Tax=Rhynocoris fuscipes TaxID=488301 RepID=A0AAW1CKF8_9HEMI